MNIVSRFRDGLYIAYNSFALIWQHPIVLIYLAIPAFIHIAAFNLLSSQSVCTFTLIFGLDALINNMLAHASWLRYLGVWLLNAVNMFMLLIFSVALARHGIIVLNEHKTSIRKCLLYALKQTKIIGIWAALSACVVFLLQVTGVFNYSLYFMCCSPEATTRISIPFQLIMIIISIVLILMSFFVVPIIAVEPRSTWRNVRNSLNTVLNTWIEIIGGLCWLCIVIALFLAPCLILDKVGGAHAGAATGSFILLASSLLGIIFSFCLSTAYTLFKANLYHTFQKRLEVLLEFVYFPYQFD